MGMVVKVGFQRSAVPSPLRALSEQSESKGWGEG